jgi:hypothetical protein
MDVIRHQAKGMHLAIMFLREFAQMEQVQHMITLTVKTSLTVVPALNDVQGDPGQDETGLSGHYG